MANRREKVEAVTDLLFLGSKITENGDCSNEIRWLFLGMNVLTNLYSVLKSKDITLLTKVCIVKTTVFPIVMYSCESWIIKKAEHWRIDASNCVAGEDSWESLGQQGGQTSQLKGNQPSIFIVGTDAKAPIFWPPDVNSRFIGKDPDAGKNWRQEKGTTEDEMVGWLPWRNGHEGGQTAGDGDGQGSLVCCSPWGRGELDTTWWPNNTRAGRASLVA